jgi:hypothetical protein
LATSTGGLFVDRGLAEVDQSLLFAIKVTFMPSRLIVVGDALDISRIYSPCE